MKPTDVNNIYDQIYRLCAHGRYQVHGLDFDQEHAPVASNTSLRIFVALCAVLNMKISASDVSNAFQSTNRFAIDKKPLHLTCPQSYLSWFTTKFPHAPIEQKDSPFVLEIFMNMQGTKKPLEISTI